MRAIGRLVFCGSALLVLIVGGPGCRTAHHEGGHFRRASPKDVKDEVDDLKRGGAKDVLLIPVFPDGKVFPKTIPVKTDYHAIVWFAMGPMELTVLPESYEKECPDFPGKIKCKKDKLICSTPHIKAATGSVFCYSGYLGSPPGIPLDPRIEIVN